MFKNPCVLCLSPDREDGLLCVVEHVGDIWALERAGMYRGRYHVLGGVLSALDGVRVDDLNIPKLLERASDQSVEEVILAMNATVDGQATAHYLTDRLKDAGVIITRLAHGVPIGGELDYLDDGTLAAAPQQPPAFILCLSFSDVVIQTSPITKDRSLTFKYPLRLLTHGW